MPNERLAPPPRNIQRRFGESPARFTAWGLMLLLVLALSPSAWGADSEFKPSVEPALLRQIQKDDGAGYMIYFREKADLSAAQGMEWQARGRFVTAQLRETAERSQKSESGPI
ncbi:MAG TPA: hypothetical protein PK535_08645 [Synergistaceae bacterium]|nr:hypothetical protein [Synergistaceae bacterium]HQH79021.1 hypothetical protein [Synergistaceae bacterium]